MLADPTADEHAMLSSIPYQPNEVVLHTDTSLMPKRRKAWSAWNYRLPANPDQMATVTYDMNTLQGIQSADRYLVSLNSSAMIKPSKVLRRFEYDHPVFNQGCVEAQEKLLAINGAGRTWFCGAWCGFGFHEDGVKSALRVARDFGIDNGTASPVSTGPKLVELEA